jgi:23S rRNA pseudouridine1911/1915/1917 synthase
MAYYEIVFQDDYLLVINKPAGVVVHAGAGVKTDTLVDALIADSVPLADMGDPVRAGIVHRLDRDTEGFMVIAKTVQAHDGLSAQFRDRTVQKGYYAMVYGDMPHDFYEISAAIGRDRKLRYRRSTASMVKGTEKDAYTYVEVVKRFSTKTLVRAVPKSGRTHQIRVHLLSIGFPVIGDPLYLDAKRRKQSRGKPQPTGQLLQAYQLRFKHPITGEEMSFEQDMSKRLGATSNKK